MEAGPSLPPGIEPPLQPSQRRCRDLELPRFLLGLAAAPILPAIVMTGLFFLADSINSDEESWMKLGDYALILAGPSLWSMLCGLLYLHTIGRWRGTLGRIDCLLLGCASAFLYPALLFTALPFVLRGEPPSFEWRDLQYFAVFGLVCTPFGLFSGWVFWRFGVRPARAPTADYAPVFD